jgi:two-component system, chemotaxis family, chemotaxis protein CheY
VARVLLIAEDDPATLTGLATYLSGAGFSVIPLPTFTEAHRIMPFAKPDVVVADVRLGEYNGLQLAVQARALDPVPVIVVTSGFDDAVLKSEAERLGATFLLKPLDPAALVKLITSRLGPR